MPLPPPPVFFCHQALQLWRLLPPVGVARQADDERPPGFMASWDHVHLDGAIEGVQAAPPLKPILADPGVKEYGRATIQTKTAASWIGRAAPTTPAEWDATTGEALDAQRSLGSAALIIPSNVLQQPDWPDGLQRAVDAARRAYTGRRADDPEILVRVCVSEQWITDQRFRRTLLNQLTDLPVGLGVALHVMWADANNLVSGADQLAGLKQIVEVLSGDGRRVFLLEAGLTGWLSIAWGAWGFTAGLSGAMWHRNTAVVRRSGGSAPAVEWYFERQLLHTVRRATHRRISNDSSYNQCPCTFCDQLDPSGTGDWSKDLSQQHGLWSLAELTDRVAAPRLTDRHARVAAIIDTARTFADGLNLTGEAKPRHLDSWKAVV